jgi:hypothetical protein
VLRAASLTWPRIIFAKHLTEHGAAFNCDTTMEVSYRCPELLSHQVCAHIKHSTITATVRPLLGRPLH